MTNTKTIAVALMIATGAMASNANAAMMSPSQSTPVIDEMAVPDANLHVVGFGDRFKKWGRKIKRTTRKTTRKFKRSFKRTTRKTTRNFKRSFKKNTRNFKRSFKKTTRATIRTNKDFWPRAPRGYWNETKKQPGELGSTFQAPCCEDWKKLRKPRSWFRDNFNKDSLRADIQDIDLR